MADIISRVKIVLESLITQDFRILDIVEILIIAFVVYHLILWVRRTQAWLLVRGIVLILIFMLVAEILQFKAILWIFNKLINILAIAIVVIFQPELRR
ncbi:MAG: TIGR00159 family protein, partial [Lachnospiraceae bacterium]|nr:TIGR00159 family protein [Lachnospiraceae bacterium]